MTPRSRSLLRAAMTAAALVAAGTHAGFELFSLSPAATLSRSTAFRDLARAKRVLYRLPDGLEPAYHVELSVAGADGSQPRDFAYTVSAADGRVTAHPTERWAKAALLRCASQVGPTGPAAQALGS